MLGPSIRGASCLGGLLAAFVLAFDTAGTAAAQVPPATMPSNASFYAFTTCGSPTAVVSNDPVGDGGAQGYANLVGDVDHPSLYFAVDATYLYLRMRVGGDPTNASGAFLSFGWGFALDADPLPATGSALADAFIVVTGAGQTADTVTIKDQDAANGTTADVSLAPAGTGPNSWAVASPADAYVQLGCTGNGCSVTSYFITVALPKSTLATFGITGTVNLWAGTSNNLTGFQTDLLCSGSIPTNPYTAANVGFVPVSCGNSALDSGETCDDGNSVAGDGCSNFCRVENGYACVNSPLPSTCTATAVDTDGDGVLDVDEYVGDTDGDSVADFMDPDDDGDGVPTTLECAASTSCSDTDGDGRPDYRDVDSDDDCALDGTDATRLVAEALVGVHCTGTRDRCVVLASDPYAGTCVACVGNAQCGGNTPVCELSNGTCVACDTTAHPCPGSLTCDTVTGACGGCTSSAQCGGASPVCDVGTGTCVPCSVANPCPTGVCDVSGACVGCVDDGACSSPLPVCDLASHRCVECTSTDIDECRASTPVCNVSTHTCVRCTQDAQCPSVLPICSVGSCVEDGDPDGDGLLTSVERSLGTNPDDPDTDGDGIRDGVEVGSNTAAPIRSDSDARIDALDTDSDGDGLLDAVECATPSSCADTDGTGGADFRDPDDDGDGIPTAVEVADSVTTGGPGADVDLDGSLNWLDTDADGDGVPDASECTAPQAPSCPDGDGDRVPEYLDAPVVGSLSGGARCSASARSSGSPIGVLVALAWLAARRRRRPHFAHAFDRRGGPTPAHAGGNG